MKVRPWLKVLLIVVGCLVVLGLVAVLAVGGWTYFTLRDVSVQLPEAIPPEAAGFVSYQEEHSGTAVVIFTDRGEDYHYYADAPTGVAYYLLPGQEGERDRVYLYFSGQQPQELTVRPWINLRIQ